MLSYNENNNVMLSMLNNSTPTTASTLVTVPRVKVQLTPAFHGCDRSMVSDNEELNEAIQASAASKAIQDIDPHSLRPAIPSQLIRLQSEHYS